MPFTTTDDGVGLHRTGTGAPLLLIHEFRARLPALGRPGRPGRAGPRRRNSMGGFCALHLGLRHPERARSLVVAGCGYGAHPSSGLARYR